MTYDDLSTLSTRRLLHYISDNPEFKELQILCLGKNERVISSASGEISIDDIPDVEVLLASAKQNNYSAQDNNSEESHYYSKVVDEAPVESETVSLSSAMHIAEERLNAIIDAGNADDFTIKKLKRQLCRLKNKIKRM